MADPGQASLSWWLVAIHRRASCCWWPAACPSVRDGMLHDLADSRARRACSSPAPSAREDLRRMGEDALVAVRTLAERPTLQRLIAQGQS